MTSCTPEDFVRVAEARAIDIATRRKDGSLRSYVPIWVVSDGSDLYGRSWKGTDGVRGTATLCAGARAAFASMGLSTRSCSSPTSPPM